MEENKPHQAINQLCKSGCGYFGSSNFDGYCSQCFKEKETKELEENGIRSFIQQKPFGDVEELISSRIETESNASTKGSLAPSSSTSSFSSILTGDTVKTDNSNSDTPINSTQTKKNRCSTCRKKVGLTGFSCRCGGQYCSIHRYSDSHSCTFDYKEDGILSLRKANPRVISDKVTKI